MHDRLQPWPPSESEPDTPAPRSMTLAKILAIVTGTLGLLTLAFYWVVIQARGIPNYRGATKIQMHNLAEALDVYHIHKECYPSPLALGITPGQLDLDIVPHTGVQ